MEGVEEEGGEDRRVADARGLFVHVHEMDGREGAARDAVRDARERVLAVLGVLPGFERRRGASEDGDGPLDLRAHHRDVARMVARRLVLLVGGIVFLVHDDETEVPDGREDRAARPHHHARLARADTVPLVVTLPV